MAPIKKLTRSTLTLEQKAKLIEDSQKPGFVRKDAMEKYEVTKSTLSRILSNKDAILQRQPQITDIFKPK